MIGIFVILGISWGLLYLLEKRGLSALGFSPIPKRLGQFIFGFMISAILCTSVELWKAVLVSSNWVMNESASGNMLMKMLFWDFKSVFTEELVFRGALLFILIARIGAKRGILISAAAFGIYHWFSYGVFGSLMPMIFVFIGTGLMGYAWAVAFSRSKSILMPLGLHLGWNFIFNSIFSNGPLGDGLFVLSKDNEEPGWFSLIGLIVIPLITLLVVKFFVKQEIKK